MPKRNQNPLQLIFNTLKTLLSYAELWFGLLSGLAFGRLPIVSVQPPSSVLAFAITASCSVLCSLSQCLKRNCMSSCFSFRRNIFCNFVAILLCNVAFGRLFRPLFPLSLPRILVSFTGGMKNCIEKWVYCQYLLHILVFSCTISPL